MDNSIVMAKIELVTSVESRKARVRA